MILGITGTHGGGKGAVVDVLVEKLAFAHYSAREVLIEEIKKRGLPVNRGSMMDVANDLAATHGPQHLAELLYAKAEEKGGDVVIESIRRVGEVEALRRKGNFHLIAVDADPQVRYERAVKRGSETDKVTYEQFLEEELREMESDDPTKQNVHGVMALADVVIQNDSTLEALGSKVIEEVNLLRET